MNINKIQFYILLITLLFCSCKKERTLGDITIDVSSVKNWPGMTYSDVAPEIYSADNTQFPIFYNLSIDGDGKLKVKDLLPGNYIFKFTVYWNLTNTYTKPGKAFQIKANEETNLVIDYQKDWVWK